MSLKTEFFPKTAPQSAAAGCMVCVTAQEMIPEAVEPDEVAGVISIVLGFALMMALDVAL